MVPGALGVARFDPGQPVPAWAHGEFAALLRTPAELTVVVADDQIPANVTAERGFRAMAVRGPVPFSTVGLLAALTGALASAEVSVFALSTFDTDWILVRSSDLAASVAALRRAGFPVHGFPARPTLLLDLLDTLVADPIHREIPAFLGLPTVEYFKLKDPTAWVDFELGRCDHPAFCARMFADRRRVDPGGLLAAVEAGWSLLPGIDALLARLGPTDVHVVSNYPIWWRAIAAREPLRRRVDRWFVSCETGVRKPDPEAYLGVARALGRAPGECVFVDDKPRNVSAAQRVGMTGIVFAGADGLAVALERVGVTGR